MIMVLILTQVYLIPVSADQMSKNGFEWDSSCYNVVWANREYVKVYSKDGGLLGTMTYYVGVGRRKGTNDYILMTKETMTPNSSKVRLYTKGNSKYYGYGLSEYVSLWTILPGNLYDVRFGVASKASRSPGSIYSGLVYKSEANRIYSFTIAK